MQNESGGKLQNSRYSISDIMPWKRRRWTMWRIVHRRISQKFRRRINEHVEKYEKKDKNSVLFKHMEEKNGERRQQITVERLATCPGDPMLRQVSEAVYIQELLPTLNSKEEWENSNIPRKRQNNNNRFLEDCDVESVQNATD